MTSLVTVHVNDTSPKVFPSFCLDVHSLTHSFTCSLTHSMTSSLPPTHHSSLQEISVFLNRSEASISAGAQVFYISPSFRLADRSIRGWGPIPQAMVLAGMFALVPLISYSNLICTDTSYKILDVATRACIIFSHGCFFTHSKSPVVHSVFYFVVNVKRHVDFIQNGINLRRCWYCDWVRSVT